MLRAIYNAVRVEGGLQGLTVTKSTINSAHNASLWYKEAFAKAKGRKHFPLRQEEERKRKKLAELKIKKAKLVEDTNLVKL